jgi:uncharacterized membrane protein
MDTGALALHIMIELRMGGAIFPLPLSHHELYKDIFPEKISLRNINLSLYATRRNIRGVEVYLHSFLTSALG